MGAAAEAGAASKSGTGPASDHVSTCLDLDVAVVGAGVHRNARLAVAVRNGRAVGQVGRAVGGAEAEVNLLPGHRIAVVVDKPHRHYEGAVGDHLALGQLAYQAALRRRILR